MKCNYCNKEKTTYYKKLDIYVCAKHRSQLDRHGKILTSTRFDYNEIYYYDTYAEVQLYYRDRTKRTTVKIDLEDVDMISKYRWSYHYGYAVTRINKKLTFMHRMINNTPEDVITDHINRDKLDNRKSNLRNATVQENALNVYKKNYCYDKTRNKWFAYSDKVNGKRTWQKRFDTEEEAINFIKEIGL